MRLRLRRRIGGLAVLLFAAGCGGTSEDGTDELLAPDPAAAPPASLVVAGPGGVSSISPGAVRKLVTGRAVIAVDDTQGGVLFQRARGRFDTPGVSTTIRWVRPGSDAPEDLVEPREGEQLELEDALRQRQGLDVFYTRSSGSTIKDSTDLLVRLNPQTGRAAELGEVGGWEWGSAISITPALIGLTSVSEAYRSFEFLDPDGAPRKVPANPLSAPVLDCSHCPDLLELSHDAKTLAYVEFSPDARGYRIIPEVVLLDTESAAERRRLRLERPEGGWVPASLDLGDDILVVNRWTSGEVDRDLDRPWVIDLRGNDPVVWEAPIAGNARLLRSQLEVEPLPED
jgi:hypothetical protein